MRKITHPEDLAWFPTHNWGSTNENRQGKAKDAFWEGSWEVKGEQSQRTGAGEAAWIQGIGAQTQGRGRGAELARDG